MTGTRASRAQGSTDDAERFWLTYAHRILASHEHQRACSALGGSPAADDTLAADVRWPGYLGDGYRAGGVLWVNIVHTTLSQGWTQEGADGLAAVARTWRDGGMPDEEYLRLTRAGYLQGFASWNVGKEIRKVLTALDSSVEQFAYMNAARCQVVPDGAHGPRQRDLLMYCQGWLPIREVVDGLRPGLIFCTATAVAPTLIGLPGDPIVVVRTQRNGARPHGWQPTEDRPWLDSLRDDYRARAASLPEEQAPQPGRDAPTGRDSIRADDQEAP